MSGELLLRTACGLYVVPDGKHRLWSGFTWTTKVADMPGDQENPDALSLIGAEVMGQFGQHHDSGQFVTPRDVAFACLHDGEVERYDHAGLDYADPEVTDQMEHAAARLEPQPWTVCGLVEETWQAVCFWERAGAAPVAYLRAWERLRDEHGRYLLLAAVHAGHHQALPTFGYADPWIRDGAAMQAKARDEWGIR